MIKTIFFSCIIIGFVNIGVQISDLLSGISIDEWGAVFIDAVKQGDIDIVLNSIFLIVSIVIFFDADSVLKSLKDK